jgi:hypothetical protein
MIVEKSKVPIFSGAGSVDVSGNDTPHALNIRMTRARRFPSFQWVCEVSYQRQDADVHRKTALILSNIYDVGGLQREFRTISRNT